MKHSLGEVIRCQKGAVLALIGIGLMALLGVLAFSIDLAHLAVIRNELQNAADAGALAGAGALYTANGASVSEDANTIALNTARANRSGKEPVAVSAGDVERGHYSFATRTFTPNPSLVAVPLWNVSAADLDRDPNFINAVRVRTHRSNTPSFFGKVLGTGLFDVHAEAVAYIGFAGYMEREEFDEPFAICKQAITSGDQYTCTVGRMLNSGGTGRADHQSAGWTNFTQPCSTANAKDVKSLTKSCQDPKRTPELRAGRVTFGQDMGTTEGTEHSALMCVIDDWKNAGLDSDGDGWPDKPWRLTVPVIDCALDMKVGNCARVVGAVTLNVIWIADKGKETGYSGGKENDKNSGKQYGDVPRKMQIPGSSSFWTCDAKDSDKECWEDFVKQFNLKDPEGNDADLLSKTIYFLPDCSPHEPTGKTADGENFGILARIPLLVR